MFAVRRSEPSLPGSEFEITFVPRAKALADAVFRAAIDQFNLGERSALIDLKVEIARLHAVSFFLCFVGFGHFNVFFKFCCFLS